MPQLTPQSVDTAGLSARDARLAVAIHRTVLQRYLTLEYLLDQHLKKPLRTCEPMLAAILLSGAAQLVFMDKIPAHAAIDESVQLAKNILRAGAGKLANAVLRRVADDIAGHEPDTTYTPSCDTLPAASGIIRLARPLLPEDEHAQLAIATSHPVDLIQHHASRGLSEAKPRIDLLNFLLHNLQTAPTIVHSPDAPPADCAAPHEQPGFYLWQGSHTQLVDFLGAAPGRWVQDPTAAAAAQAARDLPARRIVDFCAGRGTKSRQLKYLHPAAEVIATDPDAERFKQLELVPDITAVAHDAIGQHAGRADLLVLDVPCSNTGVLARRLEARYRFSAASLASVVDLQCEIFREAAGLLAPAGHVLYTTCSIEPEENQQQTERLAAELDAKIIAQHTTLPGGSDTTYHDGGYFALLQRPA